MTKAKWLLIIDSLRQTQGSPLNSLVVSCYFTLLLFETLYLPPYVRLKALEQNLRAMNKERRVLDGLKPLSASSLQSTRLWSALASKQLCRAFKEANPQRTTQV